MLISKVKVMFSKEVHLSITSLQHTRPKLDLKIIHISNRMANSQIPCKTLAHIHNLPLKAKQLVKKQETVIYTTKDLRKIPEAFQIL